MNATYSFFSTTYKKLDKMLINIIKITITLKNGD